MGSMMVFASETLPQEPEVASVFWVLGALAAVVVGGGGSCVLGQW